MVSQEALATATRRLVEQFDPDKIVLFGSQARGTADARSDVDLLIVLPLRGQRRALMTAIDRALADVDFASDVLVLTPEEYERDRWIPGTIARSAALEGRVLYERAK